MQHTFQINVCSCVTHVNQYMCHVQLQQPRYTHSSAVYELNKKNPKIVTINKCELNVFKLILTSYSQPSKTCILILCVNKYENNFIFETNKL